jgi:CheY-like chemotaxis protein
LQSSNNAIKFTPEGGTVSIRSSNSDGNFQVDTLDTDIGPPRLPLIHDAAEPGSAVTISPPTDSPAAPHPAIAPAPEPEPAAEEAREIRILLVDDHVDTSKVMKMLLERRGYKVSTADSVGTALEQVRGHEFDLMISDIGLPDGSGLDLMRTIKAEGRELKAVALSGFGMEEDIRRSMEAGFHEHLTKPVGVQKLQEVIHRLIA